MKKETVTTRKKNTFNKWQLYTIVGSSPTRTLCPVKNRTELPVFISQSLTVLSHDPVAK